MTYPIHPEAWVTNILDYMHGDEPDGHRVCLPEWFLVSHFC